MVRIKMHRDKESPPIPYRLRPLKWAAAQRWSVRRSAVDRYRAHPVAGPVQPIPNGVLFSRRTRNGKVNK